MPDITITSPDGAFSGYCDHLAAQLAEHRTLACFKQTLG